MSVSSLGRSVTDANSRGQTTLHDPKYAGGAPEIRVPEAKHREASANIDRWQQRLLPTLVKIVVGLALFFFVASFLQLLFLQWNLRQGPDTRIDEVLASMPISAGGESLQSETLRLRVAAAQEADLADRRYYIGRVTLMAHLWIRYLGFVTGMIMTVIGATFILGKLREERAELNAETANVKFSLISASPGLVLAVLGSGLMLVTIIAQQETQITDAAIYMPTAEPETIATTGPRVNLPADLTKQE